MRRHPSGCVSQCSDCLRALMLRIGYLTLLAARAVVARVGGMRRADKTPGRKHNRRSHRDDWIAAELRGRRRTSSRSEIIPASLPSIALRKRVAENLCSQLHNGSGFFCRHQLRIRIGTGSRVAAAWTLESSSVHQPELSMTTGRRLGQLDHKEDSSNIKR